MGYPCPKSIHFSRQVDNWYEVTSEPHGISVINESKIAKNVLLDEYQGIFVDKWCRVVFETET